MSFLVWGFLGESSPPWALNLIFSSVPIKLFPDICQGLYELAFGTVIHCANLVSRDCLARIKVGIAIYLDAG